MVAPDHRKVGMHRNPSRISGRILDVTGHPTILYLLFTPQNICFAKLCSVLYKNHLRNTEIAYSRITKFVASV